MSPVGRLLVTQLYFPGEPRNAEDALFDPALVVRTSESEEGVEAAFTFVLEPD